MKQATFASERCFLRTLTVADAPEFFRLNNDPEVLKYTGDVPFQSIEEAQSFLAKYTPYQTTGMGRWAVIRKEDGAWLGWCGLRKDPESGEVDIGFRFHRHFWGQGFASETAMASLTYGFEQLGLKKIIGRAACANVASIRILEKCGMHFVDHIEMSGMKAVLYMREQ